MSIYFHRIRRKRPRGDNLHLPPRVSTICSRNVMILILTYLPCYCCCCCTHSDESFQSNRNDYRNVVVSIILTWCFFNTNRFIFLRRGVVRKKNEYYCVLHFFLRIFQSFVCGRVFFLRPFHAKKRNVYEIFSAISHRNPKCRNTDTPRVLPKFVWNYNKTL